MEYSDMQRLRGDLPAAAETCAKALAGYREIGDGNGIASTQFECAQIALDRGDISAAQAGVERVRSDAVRYANSMLVYNADLLQAQIAMGHGDWTRAVALLQRSIKTATEGQLVTGEAIAQSQLAICYAKLGRDAERDRAAARAKELRSRVTERQEVFAVDIALAQLGGGMGQQEAAAAVLRELAVDADKRQLHGWALESRLALLQLLESWHDPSAAALRDQVTNDARGRGFGWILIRLRDGKPSSPRVRAATSGIEAVLENGFRGLDLESADVGGRAGYARMAWAALVGRQPDHVVADVGGGTACGQRMRARGVAGGAAVRPRPIAQYAITVRITLPSCIRSNARLICSSGSTAETNSSTLKSPAR
jgi:tetratricopeptide (TPR) repeat protein